MKPWMWSAGRARASISMLQRRLRMGYNRAARLMDALEEQKIIGPQEPGAQTREVLDYGSGGDETPEEPEEEPQFRQ